MATVSIEAWKTHVSFRILYHKMITLWYKVLGHKLCLSLWDFHLIVTGKVGSVKNSMVCFTLTTLPSSYFKITFKIDMDYYSFALFGKKRSVHYFLLTVYKKGIHPLLSFPYTKYSYQYNQNVPIIISIIKR